MWASYSGGQGLLSSPTAGKSEQEEKTTFEESGHLPDCAAGRRAENDTERPLKLFSAWKKKEEKKTNEVDLDQHY